MSWARRVALWTAGLGLAAFTQYWAFCIGAGGDGWISPFFLSPLLFVLNPVALGIAFDERSRPRVAASLLAMGALADVYLIFVTADDEAARFWRGSAFTWNLGWIALWLLWQIALLARSFRVGAGASD